MHACKLLCAWKYAVADTHDPRTTLELEFSDFSI